MISKGRIKLIRSLKLKKNRDELRLFVAEGTKALEELLRAYECEALYCTAEWLAENERLVPQGVRAHVVEHRDIKQVSFMKTAPEALAVLRMREPLELSEGVSIATNELCLALDGVQDPGNLGTIMRLADWFGISTVFASPDTADVYSPKCVQATMGAMARVGVCYTHLPHLIDALPQGTPVYGTVLDGRNMYGENLSDKGLIVLGNEGNGISPEVAERLTGRLFIPGYPADSNKVESLNVAMAGAIVMAEFRRRSIKM